MARLLIRLALVLALVAAAGGGHWWCNHEGADGARMARLLIRLGLVLALEAAAGRGYGWWHHQSEVGVHLANGRVEATEGQLASRLAGTRRQLPVQEGERVDAGALIARLDSAPLEAELARVDADVQLAREQLNLAQAQQEQADSECQLARSHLKRLESLSQDRYVSEDQLDVARTRVETSAATCRAAAAQVKSAEARIAVALAGRKRIEVDLADLTLKAPISGRIQHRLVEPGEVLPAGGRVVSLVSDQEVYLTLFLPTEIAGRLRLGQPRDIVLDAHPDRPIPARVTLVSPQAQFTPKSVETAEERARLMFRVRLQVEPDFLRDNADWLKPGMPGYARFERLQEPS